MTLADKFRRLKIRIPGNREKHGYEETFGMPRENIEHITPLAPHCNRILSELEFAVRLSAACENSFDALISSALDFLGAALDDHGALTFADADEAEKMLLPMAEEAKKYKVICAAHAHIDMNWMWSFRETVAITLSTFTTILNIMDEYPDFCYTQSQASVYKIVEDYAPELMPRIQQRIREGRWEPAVAAWVETDKNMPSGESLLRHIEYSRRYMRDVWDVDEDRLDIDFSPDTFGHSANVPEINVYSGVKYYYHCRGLDGDQVLFRWKAPSGSEILVYREPYWYNSAVTPKAGIGLIDISRRTAGLKTGLAVYGVGDHGGGPTRRDVEAVKELNSWPVFPRFVYGTVRDYFKEAESTLKADGGFERLPVLDKEINFIFGGCYTTQSRIKMGNRNAERSLVNGEAVASMATFELGVPFDDCAFREAWQKVLFTHFHDLIPGSCVVDSREHAMGILNEAMAASDSRASSALQSIAAAADTSAFGGEELPDLGQSEGAGVGFGLNLYNGVPNPERGKGLKRIFMIFNPTAEDKDENAELKVWDWTGDLRWLKVTASDGTPLETQLLDGELREFWSHRYFGILVRVKNPALSYVTVVLEPGEATDYPVYYQSHVRTENGHSDFVLENEHVKCLFGYESGRLLSFIDKETGRECLTEASGLSVIQTDVDSNDGWHIGRYVEEKPLTYARAAGCPIYGGLRKGYHAVYEYGASKIEYTATLDKGASALRFDIKADWREFAVKTAPVLALVLNTGKADKYLYDIPEGTVYREEKPFDVPGQSFAARADGNGRLLFVCTDTKYGFRACDGKLTSTLINTSRYPDPYSEIGEHHATVWIGVNKDCPLGMVNTANSLCNPLIYLSNGVHKGTLPADYSFINIDRASCALTSVNTHSGGVELRFCELCGKEANVTVLPTKQISGAEEVGVMGESRKTLTVKDNTVTFKLSPYSIKTVKLIH